MNCIQCDSLVPADAEFCIHCGARARQPSSAGMATHRFAPAAEAMAERRFFDQPADEYPLRRQTTSLRASGSATSVLAIISLVFGILGWTALPIFGALIAVVTGLMARRQIHTAAQPIGGEHLSTVGLILGIANLLFASVLISAWALSHYISLPPFFG